MIGRIIKKFAWFTRLSYLSCDNFFHHPKPTIMKHVIYLIALLTCISLQSLAQNDPLTQDVRKLMKINGSMEMFEMTSDQIIKQFKQQNGNVPDSVWKAVKADIIKPAFDDLREEMIPLYKKHFNQQDIQSLIEFYQSETGKMLVQKQPLIQQEVIPLSQQWGMKLAGDIQRKISIY